MSVSGSESSPLSDSSSYDSEEDDSSYTEDSRDKPEKKPVDTKANDDDSFEFEGSANLGHASLGDKPLSSTLQDEAKTSYVKNAEYDEAIELGESSNSILSTTAARADGSKPAADYPKGQNTKPIENAQYDEALELSDTQSSLNTVDTSTGGPGADSVAGGRITGSANTANRVVGQNYD